MGSERLPVGFGREPRALDVDRVGDPDLRVDAEPENGGRVAQGGVDQRLGAVDENPAATVERLAQSLICWTKSGSVSSSIRWPAARISWALRLLPERVSPGRS